jgi:uncharacterized protein YaaN involved in tellurite resistance
MSGLHIDFNSLDNDVPEDIPIGPAEKALNEQIGDGKPQSLVCFDLLDESTQTIISSEAMDLYDRMADDTAFLMEYGQDSVDSMNALIDSLFNDMDPVEIPEITELMGNLTTEMGTLHDKYNVRNPKILKAIDKAVQGKGRFLWSKADNHVQGMLYDARDTKGKVDVVHAELLAKKQHMLKNASMYDRLYKVNQLEILKMIRVIATLEQVRMMAELDMQEVASDPDIISAGEDNEKVGEISDFIRLVDLQITAFKDRLIYGWTTGPDIRRSRHAVVALAHSINSLMKLTVPTMQGTVLKWILLVEAKQAAQLKGVVADAANMWNVAGAEASAEAIPEITRAALAPVITEDTINRIAELAGIQTEKLLEVYNDVNEQQEASNNAMYRTRLALQKSNIELAEVAIEDDLIQRAKRLS